MVRTKHEIFFSNEDEELIKKMYVDENKSTVVIGKHFGISHHTVTRVLEKYEIRRTGESRRHYALDQNYFDVIDTPTKAYIFGFLCADGSVSREKQTVSMSLQEGDKDILERIRNEVKSEKPLEFLDYSQKDDFGYSYQNQYRLLFFSAHMVDALIANGMLPRKSYTLVFPDAITDELLSHFVRGYFDGNGSVSPNCYSISITSTDAFCKHLAKIVKEKIDVNFKIADASCHNGITRTMSIYGFSDVSLFLRWIYKDADIMLERKYQTWRNYINNSLPTIKVEW